MVLESLTLIVQEIGALSKTWAAILAIPCAGMRLAWRKIG